MQVTLLCTNNEKFAYAYSMEKSILANKSKAGIYVYGGVEELTRRLSESRWLLVPEMRSQEIDVERINERVQFRVIESAEEAARPPEAGAEAECAAEFHVFPSKKLKELSDYVKFLIGLQKNGDREIVIIDDLIGAFDPKVAEMVYSMLPPHSILTVASHPASRQFEVQRLVERGIVETIKLDWESDRMTFGFN